MQPPLQGSFVRALAACLAVLVCTAPLRAHFGDAAFDDLPYAEGYVAGAGEPLVNQLAYIVMRAGTLPVDGATLLPAGTTLDSAQIDAEHVLHVSLTIPQGSTFGPLSESRAGSIEHAFSIPMRGDTAFRGMSIRVRIGSGAYQSLGAYLAPVARSSLGDTPASEGETVSASTKLRTDAMSPPTQQGLGGPLANADGQPVGALSGVVVYCNAGHGWTAGSSSWSLQRPLLFSMVEDYGNIDQLNVLAQYLYNAGAVVVPFRPVGYQPLQIVLDNDDPTVTYTGAWSNSTATTEYYENHVTNSGVPYRYVSAAATESATARYTPTIVTAGFYPVYCWTRDGTDRVTQTYRVRTSGGGTGSMKIDHRRVGKGWIWLGTYYFEAGTGGYVEITNQSSDSGVIIADAIRFGNGMGDIVRPGPNSVSGYPRDEECARYWAQSELGNNAVGMSSTIWDSSDTDSNDNVSTAARWAKAMNRADFNADRWRRVYVEYHSNASSGTARGVVALYNVTPIPGDPDTAYGDPTENQLAFATLLGNKIEADMVALNGQFEFTWGTRSPNTYHAGFNYGAISGNSTGDEFDATIIEVAFHDNSSDAALLRDLKVRDALARSTTQGLINFLSDASIFPGTQVPLVYPPEAPGKPRATHDGNGNVVVSWVAPSSAAPNGSAATGYKVSRSSNGYAFGQAVDVGNVTSTLLNDIPSGTTTYLRVSAYNAGGESMPSETLAVRRPGSGHAQVLIVNAFDRVSRQLNPIQQIPGSMERQIARRINSFDYSVQHAVALSAAGYTFDSTSHGAVAAGTVSLTGYGAVVWICGRESSADRTFDATEQSTVTSYLAGGGRLFVTGTDLGYDLDSQSGGISFFRNTLKGSYAGDDAGTFTAVGTNGCMAGLAAFTFDTASGAPYVAASADRIGAQAGATSILSYSGGTGDSAGIQYDSGVYRLVMLGIPFECIGSAAVRANVMARVMNYLQPDSGACGTATLTSFDGYNNGTQVMFRPPTFANTAPNLLASPNVATVTDEVGASDGTKSYKLQWRFVDTSLARWLRLTTVGATNLPNPTIDLKRAVRLRLRFEAPVGASLRIALGARETGTTGVIGTDGGSTGPIEWVGASSLIGSAPQGQLITAQPGVWQTITFAPDPAQTLAFTGDGTLWTASGKGVLEHLAFSLVDSPGDFTVYLDNIEQPCPSKADFDGDGDVDILDFGHLQSCLTGSSNPQNNGSCLDARLDNDLDVDGADVALFINCISGPDVVPDPNCGL